MADQQNQDRGPAPQGEPGRAVAPFRSGGVVGSIVPQTYGHVKALALDIFESGLAPTGVKNAQGVAIIIMCGLDIGFKPMQALKTIAVINGRPSIYGDGAIGLCLASGLLETFAERIEGEGDNRVAICRVVRKGMDAIEARFSVEDAKVAGLWQTEPMVRKRYWDRSERGGRGGYRLSNDLSPNDSPWFRYQNRMLAMRARAFALRDRFADVLQGLHLAEEQEDVARKREDDAVEAQFTVVDNQKTYPEAEGEQGGEGGAPAGGDDAGPGEDASASETAADGASEPDSGKDGFQPRYFHHPESSSVMMTRDGSHPGGDGLVEEIDQDTYDRLKLEYETAPDLDEDEPGEPAWPDDVGEHAQINALSKQLYELGTVHFADDFMKRVEADQDVSEAVLAIITYRHGQHVKKLAAAAEQRDAEKAAAPPAFDNDAKVRCTNAIKRARNVTELNFAWQSVVSLEIANHTTPAKTVNALTSLFEKAKANFEGGTNGKINR